MALSVYQLKAGFQGLLRPLCKILAAHGVTANQVTISAIALSFVYGAALCLNQPDLWLCLPVILFLRMALNALDGMLAREHDMKSKLGMALNEVGDVISDTALFIPFIFFAPDAIIGVFIFIFCAALSEMCGLAAYMMSNTRRYDGPMGKSDRAFATGLLGFLIGLGVVGPGYITPVFITLSALTLWSCFNRIRGALNNS